MTAQVPERPVNNALGLWALLLRLRPINIITGPLIYGMVLPLVFLDLSVWVYQYVCFPIYKLPRIVRAQFNAFDRQELRYLDWVSKAHCSYCAYATGVAAFSTAVIGATEAYFCPIKHQHKLQVVTASAVPYVEFEEPEGFDYATQLESLRKLQTGEQSKPASTQP
jgi:hypothetical protein